MAVSNINSNGATRFAHAMVYRNPGERQYLDHANGLPGPNATGLNDTWDTRPIEFGLSNYSVTTGGVYLFHDNPDQTVGQNQPLESLTIKNTGANDIFVGVNAASGVWSTGVGFLLATNEEHRFSASNVGSKIRNAWAAAATGAGMLTAIGEAPLKTGG